MGFGPWPGGEDFHPRASRRRRASQCRTWPETASDRTAGCGRRLVVHKVAERARGTSNGDGHARKVECVSTHETFSRMTRRLQEPLQPSTKGLSASAEANSAKRQIGELSGGAERSVFLARALAQEGSSGLRAGSSDRSITRERARLETHQRRHQAMILFV